MGLLPCFRSPLHATSYRESFSRHSFCHLRQVPGHFSVFTHANLMLTYTIYYKTIHQPWQWTRVSIFLTLQLKRERFFCSKCTWRICGKIDWFRRRFMKDGCFNFLFISELRRPFESFIPRFLETLGMFLYKLKSIELRVPIIGAT